MFLIKDSRLILCCYFHVNLLLLIWISYLCLNMYIFFKFIVRLETVRFSFMDNKLFEFELNWMISKLIFDFEIFRIESQFPFFFFFKLTLYMGNVFYYQVRPVVSNISVIGVQYSGPASRDYLGLAVFLLLFFPPIGLFALLKSRQVFRKRKRKTLPLNWQQIGNF